ncbi:hypothetical protein NHF50_15190 [Flavobacterium sp. NRK F10]|uniref:hypothetical protein n=1 Tax=Flavobacterium sp. NRK F10 TaxID=2954931 RepID=UPI002091150C|nr:hypothetical protein [Flavobacterium sp. NRK F10]MCO6176393.1 hypothetical protein [Flavobacterium sp. NRK F10]
MNTISSINEKAWKAYLKSLKEPDLRFVNKNIYRFSKKNIMDGSTFVYKIERSSEDYKLIIKKNYNIQEGKGSITKKYERILAKTEWDNFENQIKNTCFWTLPIRTERRGLDGSNWLLEAISTEKNNCTERKYHAVIRWSPEKETEFYKLCQILIEFDKKK